jgi:TRAP-type C4-dicarboxylate transport system permease large subunit
MLWIFLVALFSSVLIGIPVVFSLGIANIIMLWVMDLPFTIISSRMISGMNSFPLLAIPFFMFVGEVMNHGGIARRLVKLADAFVGHITGGLGHVNILASMFLGGISGSAIADTAAIGGLMIPPMVQQQYPPSYSAAVTASSAVIGIIIPPSIPFILLVCNLLLFLIGFVMDLTPAILILAPILTPVMAQIGIDPVYFGVIMCINLGIGLVTPPVGTVLYVAAGVANIKMEALVRSLLPFLATLLVVLVLLIVFPDLVMFIPNMVY